MECGYNHWSDSMRENSRSLGRTQRPFAVNDGDIRGRWLLLFLVQGRLRSRSQQRRAVRPVGRLVSEPSHGSPREMGNGYDQRLFERETFRANHGEKRESIVG